MKQAKFYVGQIIYHKLFNYRGIIFDVDFQFCGSDEWYEKVARSKPSKKQPWYHVLVDNATHRTYVAECNMEESENSTAINNPLLELYFEQCATGRYRSSIKKN